MRRGPAILLLFGLLMGAAWGAWWSGREGLDRLTRFAPPHHATTPSTPGSTPLTGRLVLIMVDGLRWDEAHLLPSIDWLRKAGASYQLTGPGPSLPPAIYSTLLSGASPGLHGKLLPGDTAPLAADHLLRAAERGRLKTGGAGGPALGRLVGGAAGIWYEGSDTTALENPIRGMLQPNGPRLVLIQVEELYRSLQATTTANLGHADYRDGLAALDRRLTALFDLIDWHTTTVMVTGTTPLDPKARRQEGGPVPLLMAGQGVRPGARGDGSTLDLAPTAAALMGLPIPLQAEGRPLLGALQVEGRQLDALSQAHLAARHQFVTRVLHDLGIDQEVADPPGEAAGSRAYLDRLQLQLKEARFTWQRAGILERLPWIGGGALLLLLYLIAVWRQPFGGAVLMATLLYGIAFFGLFHLVGGRFGPHFAGLDLPLGTLALRIGWAAGAALALATALAGIKLSRLPFRRPSYLTTTALHLLLALAATVALPAGIGLLFVGWEFPVALPPMGLLVWFFATVLQVVVIAGLSPLWVWWIGRFVRLGQRRWPPKEIGDPELNADKIVRLGALRRSERHGPPAR